MKSSGILTVRDLAMACVVGVMTLAPFSLHAQGEEGVAPSSIPMPLDSAPVPPPSGPYPVPMTIQRQSSVEQQYAPMDQNDSGIDKGVASGWRSQDDESQQQGGASARLESDGHAFSSGRSAADYQPGPDRMPTFRPWEPGEMAGSVPVSPDVPEQAQKMQSQHEAVKNAPASQPQAVTGQRWQGGYLAPRPTYGYGYPPPAYGYPPAGYGYGYRRPMPFGYPAQPAPAPKPAESQQSSSTRAPQ